MSDAIPQDEPAEPEGRKDAGLMDGEDGSHGSQADGSAGVDTRPEPASGSGTTRELEEQRERYLRLAAEYDNFRRRTAKERVEAESRGQAQIVKQLLDPLDDLSRFAHVDTSKVDPTTVAQGVEMVEKKMLKVLSGLGLEVVDPANQTFDPMLHEAVATEPALSEEDDHVVARVFQCGYVFNGQLLRPARVVVKQWNG